MSPRYLILIALSAVLAGCGGGGDNGGSSTPPPAPVTSAPSALAYSGAQTLVVAQQMSPMTPTVSGTVTTYTISPALPAGLSINATSGVISGTPTAIAPVTSYTVTASNSSGSTTTSVSIRVNDVGPTVSYSSDTYKFATGALSADLIPTSSAGAVTSWSINPALPAGMIFDAADGSIGGIPTAVSAPAAYVVTAANSGGQVTVSLTISVESGVLLDLGHSTLITTMAYNGTRLLSEDYSGHWVLWNSQTTEKLAGGDTVHCASAECDVRIALAGPTTVIRTSTGFEIRSSATGELLSSFAAQVSWWKLATDGSYLAAGSDTALTAWSPDGAALFSRPGNYSTALASADVGVVRIGRGPLGNVIENVTVATGASSTTPIPNGQFHSWFTDGERFIARVSNTIWIYSKAGVEQDLAALTTLENLTGQGQWYWTTTGTRVDVFEVGDLGVATTNFTANLQYLRVSSATTLTALSSTQARIVDFSSAAVAITTVTLPIPSVDEISVAPSGEWIVGNDRGVLADLDPGVPGTPRYFGYGRVWSIAGSSERFALATSIGKVLYFDADTRQLEGELEVPSTKLALSADGTVLAMARTGTTNEPGDRTLRVVSLPSETEINRWTYAQNDQPTLFDFWLSGSGGVVGRSLFASAGSSDYRWEVTTATGSPLWAANFDPGGTPNREMPIRLSFDGSQVAVPDRPSGPGNGSNVYRNGSLLTTLSGWVVGWLDDNRLLMSEYSASHGGTNYASAAIRDTSGQTLATPALPEIRAFQLLSPTTIYVPSYNAIYSVTDGAVVWSSSSAGGPGAVAGDYVVFAAGSAVRIEPYQ